MPTWLMPILQSLAPSVIKAIIKFLEQKYPGFGAVLEELISYVEGHPNSNQAVQDVKNALTTTATLPHLAEKC